MLDVAGLWRTDVSEVVHLPPAEGLSFCSCCDRTLLELGPYDRLSADPEQVSCGRLPLMDELLLLEAARRSS
jgi:hypothetical protein